MSSQSLLPDNRTPLETALEKSLAKQLQNIESPYPQLWDPAQVKPTLLPYLAHAKGVPDWGEDTEDAKRDTVANIWTVQRQAGTRQAVKQAVDALGFDAEVVWGENPYELQVTAWLENGSNHSNIQSRIQERINPAKSERDQVTQCIGLRFGNQIGAVSIGNTGSSHSWSGLGCGRKFLAGLQARASSFSTGKAVVQQSVVSGRSNANTLLRIAAPAMDQNLSDFSSDVIGRQSIVMERSGYSVANLGILHIRGNLS